MIYSAYLFPSLPPLAPFNVSHVELTFEFSLFCSNVIMDVCTLVTLPIHKNSKQKPLIETVEYIKDV